MNVNFRSIDRSLRLVDLRTIDLVKNSGFYSRRNDPSRNGPADICRRALIDSARRHRRAPGQPARDEIEFNSGN